MRRLLAIVALAGGVVATVYLAAPGDVGPADRSATCGVRVSDELLALARDAGLSLSRYERVRVPVKRSALADGGLEFELPPRALDLGRGLEVMDWPDCVLETCAARPAACARWDNAVPFVVVGGVRRPCVRQRADAGLPCLRLLSDGGDYDFGDRNVYRRTEAAAPATCEPVECGVQLGEDPEEVL